MAMGAQAAPLLGIGAFFQAKVEELTLVTFSINELIETGIALPDLRSYLETPTGSEWYMQNSFTLVLQPGDVAWIPYGLAVVPICWPLIDDIRDESVAIGWHLPLLVPEWRKQLSERCWAAIQKMNQDQFQNNATATLWEERQAAFALFAKE